MEYRFLLNGIEINEPTGFDNFKPTIERTDHHGISASVSDIKLGFYGNSNPIIRQSYEADIDTELPFVVEMKCRQTDEWTEIYRGVVDLATYEMEQGDTCRINCNVGEIGVKTTFNNRYETKVSILAEQSLDGDILSNDGMQNNIDFPPKAIKYSDKAKVEEDSVFGYLNLSNIEYFLFRMPTGTQYVNEIEEMNSTEEMPFLAQIANESDLANMEINYGWCVFVNNVGNNLQFNANGTFKFYLRADAQNFDFISSASVRLP